MAIAAYAHVPTFVTEKWGQLDFCKGYSLIAARYMTIRRCVIKGTEEHIDWLVLSVKKLHISGLKIRMLCWKKNMPSDWEVKEVPGCVAQIQVICAKTKCV